jgi:catechol 2,3-dioxygenase-like lactoylglutathione lyase family enzyme
MTDGHLIMVGAATVFVVSDIARSVEHYCDRLGFTVTFQYGEPVFYACLRRDEVALHLLAAQETKRIPGNGGICVFVNDVDGVYAELAARGANVISRRRITITACGTLTFLTLMATTIRSESHPRHERCHY